MIICYTVPEIWYVAHVIIFHFGPLFALFPLQQPKKSKIWKNEKNYWRYHHFTYVHQKLGSDNVQLFLRYGVRWMDGWTDGW